METIGAGHPTLLVARDAFVCVVDNPETRRVLNNVNSSILVNAGLGGRREDVGHLARAETARCLRQRQRVPQ